MSSSQSQRGYTVDTGRRRRRQIGMGVAATVIVAVVAFIIVNATSGSSASATQFGTEMKIAYFSAFPSEEKLLDYVAKEVAPSYGLKITPVSLGEPQQIDRSVSEGENAATIYEHKYWMQQEIESGGFKIEAALPIFKWAFALYSEKYKSIGEIPHGATIAIPADPSNQAQALWLLESQGLIKIKPGVSVWSAEVGDIEKNNLGMDRQMSHGDRYELASEVVDVCYQLWEGSWEEDAVLEDREAQIYADPSKVHGIGHAGRFFSVPA